MRRGDENMLKASELRSSIRAKKKKLNLSSRQLYMLHAKISGHNAINPINFHFMISFLESKSCSLTHFLVSLGCSFTDVNRKV